MRTVLFFIICWFIPYITYAANADDYVTMMQGHQNTTETISSDFESVRAKVKQLNPELVAENQDKSEQVQAVIYRNWLAQKMFDYYKNYFINKIQTRANETGRKLNVIEYDRGTQTSCSSIFYVLSNGDLDLPKCTDNKGYQICPYPDSLEEFYIDLYDCGDEKGMFIMEDEADKDKNTSYSIDLINHQFIHDTETYTDISIISDYTVQSFTKWAKYREEDRQWSLHTSANGKKKISHKTRKGKQVEIEPGPEMPPALVTSLNFTFTAHKRKQND